MTFRVPVSRKGTTFKRALLDHLFLNQPIAGIGDAGGLLGSSADGNLYLSLHAAIRVDNNVTFTGPYNQSRNEYPITIGANTLYSGYARVAIPRTSTYWERIGDRIRNKLDITFPTIGGARAISPGYHVDPIGVGIGTDETGNGTLLYFVPCLIQSPLAHQQTDGSGNLLGYPAEAARIAAGNLNVEEV